MSGNPSDNEKALRGRKKTATTVIRVVLGIVFVFSALMKLNDPMGLAFKIQEYLSSGAVDLSLSSSLAVDAAGTLITLELILGAVLLMGRFKVFALWTLLALNALFTSVTLYSALTGAVPDCGCFGDAVVLSPWGSFVKNLVILALTVVLILWQRFIKPSVGFRTSMSVVALLFAFSLGVIYYVLRYEPFVDFRPYKTGTDIRSEILEGEDRAVYRNVWVYRVEGQEKKYADNDEPWNIPGAEFVSRSTRRVSGERPQAADFSVTAPDGSDKTDSLLALEHVLLVTCYDMAGTEPGEWKAVNELLASRNDLPAFVLADTDDKALIDRYGIAVPVYFADPTTLKTILRSNPGVMELKRGRVVAKWGRGAVADGIRP